MLPSTRIPRLQVRHFNLTALTPRTGRSARCVRMFHLPKAGFPMVMYSADGSQQIVTSRVVRVLMQEDASFVQTENGLYRLDPRAVPQAPPQVEQTSP